MAQFTTNQIGDPIPVQVSLSPSELATVLAALRAYQRDRDWDTPSRHFDGETVDQLSDTAIDRLCERINR